MSWISICDDLPPVETLVLVSIGGVHVTIAEYCPAAGGWFLEDQPVGGPLEGVTHWQKLPEPVAV